MKLYVLQRFEVSYDEADTFVIRAASPRAARRVASQHCGDEGPEPWMDVKESSCKELRSDGEQKVIIRDYHEA